MKLPNEILMKKVYWLNRYFVRIEKLFNQVHELWLNESIQNYGSNKHMKLTELKNKIYWKMQILVRYSSLLTSDALKQMQ